MNKTTPLLLIAALSLPAPYAAAEQQEELIVMPLFQCENKDVEELLRAAKFGDRERMQWLVENGGVDVNASCTSGRTALLVATAASQPLAFVDYLVEHGADVNAVDESGRTALFNVLQAWHSYKYGETEAAGIFQYLLEHGADPNAYKRAGIDLKDIPPLESNPAPYFAVVNPEVLALLLEYGADLDILSRYKEALFDDELNADIFQKYARLLLRAGLDPLTKEWSSGRTLLHRAAHFGDASLIPQLLAAGAEVDARDRRNGWTPLMVAAMKANWPEALDLLDAGADINAQDMNGRTALMLAVRNNHAYPAMLLLEAGADVSLQDHYGKTAAQSIPDNASEEMRALLPALQGSGPLPDEDDMRPRFGPTTTKFTEVDGSTPDQTNPLPTLRECYRVVCNIQDAAGAQAAAEGLAVNLALSAERLKQREQALMGWSRSNYPYGDEDDEIGAYLIILGAHMRWLSKLERYYFGCTALRDAWESALAGGLQAYSRHGVSPYTTASPYVIHTTRPLTDTHDSGDGYRERMYDELTALVMAIRNKDVIALREMAPLIRAYHSHVVDPVRHSISREGKYCGYFVTGHTLLWEALRTLDKDVLEAVLDARVADPNNDYIPIGCHIDGHEPYSIRPIHLMVVNPEAWTPIPYSDRAQSLEKMEELIKILLAHGANINATDDQGRTALHYAAGGHPCDPAPDLEVMDLLIRLGANPSAKDNAGRTPADTLKEYLREEEE